MADKDGGGDWQTAKQQADLSELFPSVRTAHGHRVHVFEDEVGEWCAWLNTEDLDFTGLCLAIGKSKRDVLEAAIVALDAVKIELVRQQVDEDGKAVDHA